MGVCGAEGMWGREGMSMFIPRELGESMSETRSMVEYNLAVELLPLLMAIEEQMDLGVMSIRYG